MSSRRYTSNEVAKPDRVELDSWTSPIYPNYEDCPECEGTGRVKGWFVKSKECRNCDGVGRV